MSGHTEEREREHDKQPRTPPSHCPQHRREHVLASLCLMGLAQYAEWLDQRTQRTSSQQLGGRGHRACHLDFPPPLTPTARQNNRRTPTQHSEGRHHHKSMWAQRHRS